MVMAPPCESVDLAERLKALDLEGNAVDLTLRGYTVLRERVPEELIDRLRARIVELAVDRGALPPEKRASYTMARGRAFEEAVCLPEVLALVEFTCGKGFIVNNAWGSIRPEGSQALTLHTDNVFVRHPYPPFPQQCTVIWACDDFTDEGGCTRLMPGSHKLGRPPEPGEGDDRAVPIECPRGSLVLWEGATWHGNTTRTLPGERVAHHVRFNRMVLRAMELYDAVPAEVLERNPPAFASMLGFDDPFENRTDSGPDFAKIVRCSQIYAS